ncbi:extradiol ring-cleavage dioxygenase [Steroidobacter flavus]|uniref:Extradiol ring-cleavage dioxygenase n=1 Tax=Steroidobacter flavus TaxID=1842136 RepID=A0ABV8SYH3_9GAMM
MAEILGIGISHYPPLSGRDEDMANILRGRLKDPDVPASHKDPANWPPFMREEWGTDQGRAGAARHRAAMRVGLTKARQAIDEFKPDLVVIWGDDQYENFKEDIVPPFCVMAYDDMNIQPWAHASESAMFSESHEDEWGGGKPNVWKEKRDHSIVVRGHRKAAKFLTEQLLEREFDVAYAYKPLHHEGLPHAFLNSILYLDYDRRGFPYPVVPFQVNCYGRSVISYRGFISRLADRGRELDPPSPSPKRIFKLGAEVARIFRDSPYRVALVASSSWSHAFLNDQTYRMQPDVALDKRMYEALTRSDWDVWTNTKLETLERSGEHELLNWYALAGAMNELRQRCTWSDFVETYVFNSSKVTAIFAPK